MAKAKTRRRIIKRTRQTVAPKTQTSWSWSSSRQQTQWKSASGTGKAQQRVRSSPSSAVVPFQPEHRILLVGEGNLSFAASLVAHHKCRHILATTFDTLAHLSQKYPQAGRHLETLQRHGVKVLHGVDAKKLEKYPAIRKCQLGTGREQSSNASDDGGSDRGSEDAEADEWEREHGSYGSPVRASSAPVRDSRERGRGRVSSRKWDRIVFNFPHVGGKSTDVNRQARYNQGKWPDRCAPAVSIPPKMESTLMEDAAELLASFFASSKPLLCDSGAVIVTLFEGLAYAHWNVRDLARHVGLRVARSFRFVPEAYPGYTHARTVGTIVGRNDEAGAGWKGETRESRSFAFVLSDGVDVLPAPRGKSSRKRKRNGSGSGSDDDEAADNTGDDSS